MGWAEVLQKNYLTEHLKICWKSEELQISCFLCNLIQALSFKLPLIGCIFLLFLFTLFIVPFVYHIHLLIRSPFAPNCAANKKLIAFHTAASGTGAFCCSTQLSTSHSSASTHESLYYTRKIVKLRQNFCIMRLHLATPPACPPVGLLYSSSELPCLPNA